MTAPYLSLKVFHSYWGISRSTFSLHYFDCCHFYRRHLPMEKVQITVTERGCLSGGIRIGIMQSRVTLGECSSGGLPTEMRKQRECSSGDLLIEKEKVYNCGDVHLEISQEKYKIFNSKHGLVIKRPSDRNENNQSNVQIGNFL
jgi:hypothetical protein